MGIFLRQSHNVKPVRWGSPAEVQFSIWDNLEKIYGCNPEDEVLIMPMFWGLPLLDYSVYGNHGTNHGATYKDGSLDFDGNDYVISNNTGMTDTNFFISFWIKPGDVNLNKYIFDQAVSANSRRAVIIGYADGYFNFFDGGYPTGTAADTQIVATIDTWQNIVMGTDGTKVFGYKNGQKVVEETGDWESTGAVNFYITSGYNTVRGAIFTIDEVRISNTDRTAAQIALFHENPYGLYRSVAKPIWSIPAAPSLYIPQIIMF